MIFLAESEIFVENNTEAHLQRQTAMLMCNEQQQYNMAFLIQSVNCSWD